MAPAALPYEEPAIETILVQSSFLVLLNCVNWILDNAIYCGLLGQILVGVAYGTPGAGWLSTAAQDTIMQLGYLGLILMVYEGGLSTSFAALWSNLWLSGAVATIGVCTPVALSFVLMRLLDATAVQAFAAGAALCSTSLGTTLTVLQTSGLGRSRLGVILCSAAMLDDVAGLVMVQVVSNLGSAGGGGAFKATEVVRPVGVSLGFAVVAPGVCGLVLGPGTRRVLEAAGKTEARWKRWAGARPTAFAGHTLLLLGLVAGSTYAGTSNLFAAYIAGAAVTWWDALVASTLEAQEAGSSKGEKEATPPESRAHAAGQPTPPQTASGRTAPPARTPTHGNTASPRPRRPEHENTGLAIYARFYAPAVATILKPLFFASIGFSIPVSRMFEGSTAWKGIVYTLLMVLGKAVCGIVLVRFDRGAKVRLPARARPKRSRGAGTPHCQGVAEAAAAAPQRQGADTSRTRARVPKPRSLYPALILGGAMVARGEIGSLISGLAESKGVFGAGGEEDASEMFLVVSWAVLLCTLVGPVGVGFLVRRVGRLRERRKGAGKTGMDPLGGWGVEI